MKKNNIYSIVVLFIAVLTGGQSLEQGKKQKKQKLSMANSVIPVTSANFEQEVLNSDKVLVDFMQIEGVDHVKYCHQVAEIANENKDLKVVN